MRKLAKANQNKNMFRMKATCDGNGWNQNGKTPCYQLWEITALDIKYRSHTDISGVTDIYYGFVCPECGCFTELDEQNIPSTVKSSAGRYYEIPSDD